MNLKKALKHAISPADLEILIRSYDIVGDIGVIMIPEGLEHHESLIAKAILDIHRNVKTILKRDGLYSGKYRTVPLSYIAGEDKTETICREFGIRLMLDLKSVYFSVRSGNERKRIADLVQPGEKILVMFSGIAPFPLMIAKYSKASSITGVEINKRAHDYGLSNVMLNKAPNISLIHGDAMQVASSSQAVFDRIVMPLPAHADLFLEHAINALAPSGALHYYDFKARASFQESIDLIAAKAGKLNRSVRCSETVVCGHNSPSSYRICVDAIID